MTSKTIACSFIALSIASVCAFPGCKKDNSPQPGMTATFNDSAFSAVGFHVGTSGGKETMTTITATNLDVAGAPIPKSITISVFNRVGVYDFAQTNGNSKVSIIFSSATTFGASVFATSGEVYVSKSEAHYIQGSFSFSCTDSLGKFIAKNGQFTGTY